MNEGQICRHTGTGAHGVRRSKTDTATIKEIYTSLDGRKEIDLHLSMLAYLLTVLWSLDSSSRNLASSSCGTVRRGK